MITPLFLREAFDQKLPGRQAQLTMSPIGSSSERTLQKKAKIAAVLAIINFSSIEPSLILIQRTSVDLRDRHAGQISLPGGKQEDDDKGLLETALRESHEEIGVLPKGIDVLGPLTPLYIPVSGFNVHPFVGMGNFKQFKREEREVESILEWPISKLLSPRAIHYIDLQIRDEIILKNTPYFDCCGHILWGATAMILSELRVLLQELN